MIIIRRGVPIEADYQAGVFAGVQCVRARDSLGQSVGFRARARAHVYGRRFGFSYDDDNGHHPITV